MRGRDRFAVFLAVLALLAAAGPAWAWGNKAHRIVADLAGRDLTPAAAVQVDVLLAGEPVPTLAGVANWPDELRESGSARGRATASWHYMNFPRGQCAYEPARDCPGGDCVIAAIERERAVLADVTRPLVQRREALKFLVHFVADVHQPLHAAFADDLGGNRHQLNFAGEGTNLHAVWDRLLVAERGMKPPAYAGSLRAQPPLPRDPTRHCPRAVEAWAIESCRIASRPDFYPPKGTLSRDYVTRQQPVADLRMREAARRLARTLNDALAPADGVARGADCRP
jgi:hypothetical protein